MQWLRGIDLGFGPDGTVRGIMARMAPRRLRRDQELLRNAELQRELADPPSDEEQNRLRKEEAQLLFDDDTRLETVRKLKAEKDEAERRLRRPRG